MMRTCRQCGFPRKFDRLFDWRGDGTIISTDRLRSRTQIAFLEAGEFEEIVDNLSQTIGLNVDPFLVKAYKNIGKTIFSNTTLRQIRHFPNNRRFRPQWLTRAFVRSVAFDVAGLGDGRISLDCFIAGECAVVRYKNPCLNALLAGSSAAIYEATEDIDNAAVEHELEDGDLVVRLGHGGEAPGEPDVEGRFYLEATRPVKGPVRYERCPACWAPVLASLMFDWDIKQGIIRNRLTGEREVIIAVQAINALLRELETELGEGIPRIIYRHQKSITRDSLKEKKIEDPERFWNDYLTDLALRGLGFPLTFEKDEDSVFVEIVNAYNQTLYAARIAAALEVVTGSSSEIEWIERCGEIGVYRIKARKAAFAG